MYLTRCTIFWEQNGIVLIDYLVRNTTITSIYYASFLLQLRKFNKDIQILQGNAPMNNSYVSKMQSCSSAYEILLLFIISLLFSLRRTVFRPFSSSWIIFEIRLIHNDDAQINEVKSEHAVFYKKDHHKCIKW